MDMKLNLNGNLKEENKKMEVSLFKYELIESIPLAELGYSSDELERFDLTDIRLNRYRAIPQLVKADDIDICEMKKPVAFDSIFKM